MKKLLNVIKIVVITAVFLCMSTLAFASGIDFKELPLQSDKSINKPWTVKFNLELDGNTINSTNVLVKSSSGKIMKTTISLGKDNKSLMIYPPVGGYIPGAVYSVELSTAVKSKDGKNLSKPTKMSFTTSKVYEDSTNYSGFPTINTIDILEKPVLQNTKTSFKITPNFSGDIQYRIFLFKYSDETFDNPNTYVATPIYTELTKGYTAAVSAVNPYTFVKEDGFEVGKYKIMVYVKSKGTVGQNKDGNTDYDNFYSTYFRVLSSNTLESSLNSIASTDSTIIPTIAYVSYDKSLDEAALAQLNGAPVYSEGNSWIKPSKELIKYYMDPNNFLDNTYKYKFLNLNYMDGVTEEDLNNILKGKGVLDGKGAVFLKAAKDSNINPIYLVAHAFLETGYGTSKLATGILVSSVNGVKVEPKTTYNMFGINAFDSDPNKYGSERAYTGGWFSVDEAILGGAKYISTDYINSEKYKQNTIYKMRWNITVSWHQYATDTGWARKQLARVKFEELMSQIKSAKPVFEIPKYK